MNHRLTSIFILIFFILAFTGCALIEDIFAAGAWVGAIAALLLVIVIFVIVRAASK